MAPKVAPKASTASADSGKQWDGPSLSDEAVTSSGPKASGDASWGAAPKEVASSVEQVVDEIKEEVKTVPAAAEATAPVSDSKLTSTDESSSASPAEAEPSPKAAAPVPAAAPAAAVPAASAPPPGLEEPSVAPAAPQQKKQPAKSQANRFRSIGDEAVIMPGGVGSGVGKVGMQFGSLSLDGEGQIYEQPSACVQNPLLHVRCIRLY